MPAWLEVLLNLSGYAGFVALASRGGAFAVIRRRSDLRREARFQAKWIPVR